MLAAQNPAAGDYKIRPKSGRKPLQPKNILVDFAKPKPRKESVEVSHKALVAPAAAFDASLAEELRAIRKRLERLRVDRERTEKMLKERDAILELQMKELENRGDIQKNLEIEVDRLYRLKQLHSQSMRSSPLLSLRHKERAKMATESGSQEFKTEDKEESVGESASQGREPISLVLVEEKN